MNYYANFYSIGGEQFRLDIYTETGSGSQELTLSDTPAIVTIESDGIFSPIKSQSCTISIETTGAMLDLYTMDPQEIRVKIQSMTVGETVFRGYVTPCQYGQDWTTIDTLTLECVDCLSSLKSIDYTNYNGEYSQYLRADMLINYLIGKIEHPDRDELVQVVKWYWPCENFQKVNGADLGSTADFLQSVLVNEANFFDDDQEHTPWSCYEVLEDLCKFLCVTLVPWKGDYYFLDYLTLCNMTGPTLAMWRYSLEDLSHEAVALRRPLELNEYGYLIGAYNDPTQYAGGTTDIKLDDVYNKVSVDANRYDIDKLVTDPYDKKHESSMTLKYDFGGQGQMWTEIETHFWTSDEITMKTNTYKMFGVLDSDSGWKHTWWVPMSMTNLANAQIGGQVLGDLTYGYSTQMNIYNDYNTLPENKRCNTIGAWIMRYTTIDALHRKPASADWKDVIMFNCLTNTIMPSSTGTKGKCTIGDLKKANPTFEKPVLTYESDFEMNYSPKDGTSWIVINGALWYQQYRKKGETNSNGSLGFNLLVTDPVKEEQTMFPIEDATDREKYIAKLRRKVGSDERIIYFGHSNDNDYGFELMRFAVQIGDKYWNGSSWTTTPSTFNMRFTASGIDGKFSGVDYNYKDDAFGYLTWMNIITNTTYEDKVGANGYAIPITASDSVCGKIKITLYTPRQLPGNSTTWISGSNSFFEDQEIDWYERAPVVFMKDFSVDYVYTDDDVWWLTEAKDKKDIEYSENSGSKRFTYEKTLECKTNSWQPNNPIAKSFPIVSMNTGSSTIKNYLARVGDPCVADSNMAQEENIIYRQLRHYSSPTKIVKMHRTRWVDPWRKVTMNQELGLSGTYVVDRQSYDLRNRNAEITFIEYGDAATK